ncbi:putative reverse transcriptase, RNA-dependent DNA polymerase [Tanacetum coccineum]
MLKDPPYSQDPKSSHDDGFKPLSDDGKKIDEDPRKYSECKDQEKEDNVNNTNNVNTVSSTVNAAGINEVNDDWKNKHSELLLIQKSSALEDDSIFDFLRDDEDDGVVVDMNNLDTTIQEEPKKVIHALKDPSWIEAILEELLQFKNKKDEKGIVIRNKARLVAQGYIQEEGIDYNEVFAPVARIKAIRLFLAYASFKDFVVYQMDVKIDFLYGKIEEEVYICQPPGFEDREFPDRVTELHKSTYMELHQATKALKSRLQVTPMETSKAFAQGMKSEEVDVHMYRSMIGSLMYLTSSRPDIMFVVCACARYQVNPNVSHLYAVKRIFRYLKGQPKLGLWYPKDSPFDLVAYTDSDYARASLDRKSTIRGFQFLGCRLISLQCKKETVVANSITEAEYVAALSCCGQVLWIQNQLLDYGYNFMHTKIFIDNNRKAKKSVRLMMEKLFGMELELILVTQS